MAIVTFWNNGKEQTGKTLSIAAISTNMAIENNAKVLVISTAYQDEVLNNCFFEQKKIKKNLGLFGPNNNIAMDEGIIGLTKVIKSNKLSPETITNYTKVIFKDRLEILQSYSGNQLEYEQLEKLYPDIINLANSYYDYVFVDLDKNINREVADKILNDSSLIVISMSQRLSIINRIMKQRQEMPILNKNKALLLMGKYDRFSKYTIKNVSRYMKEKNMVSVVPYNTLFFEAAEEANVADLFLRLKKVNQDDQNKFFMTEVEKTTENIKYKTQYKI